jgi:hypothetical protein
MVALFNEQLYNNVSQVIYDKRGVDEYDKFSASRKTIMRTPKGNVFLCTYEDEPVLLDRPMYPNPSSDVSHVEERYEFHSHKHTANPMTFSPDNLINKSDMVVFVGEPNDDVFITFEGHNALGNDFCVVDSLEGYSEKVLSVEEDDEDEKLFRCVLIVHPGSVDLARVIIQERPEKIGCVVCDTFELSGRDALLILSTCHSKGITCIRKAHRYGWFNFGVVKKEEQSRETFHSGNGVITMTNDVVVGAHLYVIYIDPRMAQITRFVMVMEMASEVWCITLIHDVYDHLVAKHHDYKFFPIFQTQGIHRISEMTCKNSIHTVIATLTPFPQIASTLFMSGIFATCDRSVLTEYVHKVNDIFDKRVKYQQREKISRVVALKLDAYTTITNMERNIKRINTEILPAVAIRNKRLAHAEIKQRII